MPHADSKDFPNACTYAVAYENTNTIARGVSRICIIGFPTNGVGRYFNRGGEATSDTQLNPGNFNSVCGAHIHEGSCKHTIPYAK